MQGAGGPGSIARLLFEAGARPRTKLRSGQIVRANVIKQIAPSKWMLGIGGRVIPAFSERALSSGMTFLAQVRIEGPFFCSHTKKSAAERAPPVSYPPKGCRAMSSR
jgi:hypothetical protein